MVCLWISLLNDIIFESNKKQKEKYWKKIRKNLMHIEENGRLLLEIAYGIFMHNLIHIASFNIQSMWLFTFTSSEFNSFSWNWKKNSFLLLHEHKQFKRFDEFIWRGDLHEIALSSTENFIFKFVWKSIHDIEHRYSNIFDAHIFCECKWSILFWWRGKKVHNSLHFYFYYI